MFFQEIWTKQKKQWKVINNNVVLTLSAIVKKTCLTLILRKIRAQATR